MAYTRTYNPCDDCQYAYSKNGQESSVCKICEFEELRTADVVPKSEVAREIIADIDDRLHDMAMEYHNAGHPEYFAVCVMVHHKVISTVEKKYAEGKT